MPRSRLARRAALLAACTILAALPLLVLPSGASAQLTQLFAAPNGAQEVPPTGSAGTGIAYVTYNSSTGLLSWNITFSGLTGPATLAHFHGPAAIGVNAGVQVDIGAISGLTSPMVGSTVITGAQATQLLSGLWYINIHTAANGGGEIRGQVQVTGSQIPTLGSAGAAALLLALASAGGFLLRRRRRA